MIRACVRNGARVLVPDVAIVKANVRDAQAVRDLGELRRHDLERVDALGPLVQKPDQPSAEHRSGLDVPPVKSEFLDEQQELRTTASVSPDATRPFHEELFDGCEIFKPAVHELTALLVCSVSNKHTSQEVVLNV